MWKTSLDYWVVKVVNIGVVNSTSAISATLRIKTPSLSFWKATNQHGSHYFRRHLRHTDAQTAMAAARPPSISRAMGNSPSQIFLKAVHDQVGSCCCSLVASPPPRRFISVQKWKLCPELVYWQFMRIGIICPPGGGCRRAMPLPIKGHFNSLREIDNDSCDSVCMLISMAEWDLFV